MGRDLGEAELLEDLVDVGGDDNFGRGDDAGGGDRGGEGEVGGWGEGEDGEGVGENFEGVDLVGGGSDGGVDGLNEGTTAGNVMLVRGVGGEWGENVLHGGFLEVEAAGCERGVIFVEDRGPFVP